MEEKKQSSAQKPQDTVQVQEQLQDLQIVEEVKEEEDYFDNLNVIVVAEIPDVPVEGEAGEIEAVGVDAGAGVDVGVPVDEGEQENILDAQGDESFDEFDDEEIDRLMNTAHDNESEI